MLDATAESASAPPTHHAWRRYPHVIAGADPAWFTFPAAEGDQGCDSNTYFIEAPLRGVRTGRSLAVMAIFSALALPVRLLGRLRTDFHVLGLFDLDDGDYGTMTEFDLPRPGRLRRQHRMRVARGHLDVAWAGQHGRSAWSVRRDAQGAPEPFRYSLDLRGRDHQDRPMEIQLDVEAGKPPAPVGGHELGGVKTCCMQLGTFSYFQTGLTLAGRVRWGDFEDEVRGDQGWIDRQFAREHFATYTDRRNERHRHEWRVIHLDNGWDMSVWQQFDAQRGDRTIPFSGVTAQGPDGEVRYTSDFEIERLSFVKDPRLVLPDQPLTKGPAFLTDRFHLVVREWGLALTAEPLVPAPAHGMPIEYWNGPVRVVGQMNGRPVQGSGFHERSKLWFDPFGLIFVLRETLRHLPSGSRGGEGDPPSPQVLADRVWNGEVLLARDDRLGTRQLLEETVAPGLDRLASPGRESAREVYDALLGALVR